MKLAAYLSFNGKCREAFAFYHQVLGGTIEAMATWGESPAAEHVGPEGKDLIIHARLVLDGGAMIMASDTPGPMYEEPKGTSVCIHADDLGSARRIFDAFAEGGKVPMPFDKTFFAEGFGVVTDRFGTPWMIIYEGSVDYDG